MQSGNNTKLKVILLIEAVVVVVMMMAIVIVLWNNKDSEINDSNGYYDPISEEYLDAPQDDEIVEGDDGEHSDSKVTYLGFSSFVEILDYEIYRNFIDEANKFVSDNYPETKYISLSNDSLICKNNICNFTIYLDSKIPIDATLSMSPFSVIFQNPNN